MDRAQTLKWHQGTDRPLDLEIYDEDPNDPGQPDLTKPVDLSGAAEIRFGLGPAASAATPLFEKTKTGGKVSVIGTSNNVVRVDMDGADTAGLAPGRYYFELWVEEAPNNQWPGPHGPFILYASLLK